MESKKKMLEEEAKETPADEAKESPTHQAKEKKMGTEAHTKQGKVKKKFSSIMELIQHRKNKYGA